jgi:hypothetical protein
MMFTILMGPAGSEEQLPPLTPPDVVFADEPELLQDVRASRAADPIVKTPSTECFRRVVRMFMAHPSQVVCSGQSFVAG